MTASRGRNPSISGGGIEGGISVLVEANLLDVPIGQGKKVRSLRVGSTNQDSNAPQTKRAGVEPWGGGGWPITVTPSP
ncbi:hypothetical protein ACFX16_036431 [Malus domestica]